MSDKESNINYTIDDIERYLNGSMSTKEMHEIELAALKDPLLADAIEGYVESNFQTSHEHLNQISAALYKKSEETKVIPITAKRYNWWNAAAMVAVVVITGAITWYLAGLNSPTDITANKESNPVPIAGNQSTTRKTDTAKQIDTMPVLAQHKKKTPPLREGNPATDYKVEDDKSILDKKNYELSLKEEPQKKESMQINTVRDTDYIAAIKPSVQPELKSLNDASLNYNRSQSKLSSTVIYNGRVTDNNNRPVPHASLLLAPGIKTSADDQGYFSIRSADSIVNVTVSAVGYEGTEKKLSSSAANNITMIPDTKTLSEAVVSEFDTQKEARRQSYKQKEITPEFQAKKDLIKKAADSSLKRTADSSTSYPSVGWESFHEYVYKELKLERDTMVSDLNVSGDVQLEFTVDDDGLPVNFKILKSLGPTPDNRAIDIVKKGPKWIPGKKNKRAKVTIKF